MQAALLKKWDEIAALALRLYGVDIRSTYHKFNITSTRLHGQAGRKDGRYYCRWNPSAMAVDLEHYLNTTVPHEAAHIVCYMARHLGGHGHNAVWRRMCIALGGTGSTRVERDNPAAQVLRVKLQEKRAARVVKGNVFLYRTASGMEHKLSSIRHTKIMRGTMVYRDTRTKEPIGREQFVSRA